MRDSDVMLLNRLVNGAQRVCRLITVYLNSQYQNVAQHRETMQFGMKAMVTRCLV